MGRRDHLTVHWQPVDAQTVAADAPVTGIPEPSGVTRTRPRRLRFIVLAATIAVAVAVHVALGVGLLTWPWASLVADAVLAVVVVTLMRRSPARRPPTRHIAKPQLLR